MKETQDRKGVRRRKVEEKEEEKKKKVFVFLEFLWFLCSE
jgi:hypothetical protein